MQKVCGMLLIFIFSFSGITAQNKRAYKNLADQDFEKTMELFKKEIDSDSTNALANFGMAMLYSHEKHPGKDLPLAWDYLQKSLVKIEKIDADEKELLKEYFLNTEKRKSSYPLHKKIKREQDRISDELIKIIREGNDLELVNRVLKKSPDFEYYDNTVHIRNYLAFRKSEKENTIETYNNFISEFPDAAQIPQAVEQRDELAWKLVVKENTIQGFDKYLKDYPDSKHQQSALMKKQHLMFLEAKNTNSIESLEAFIKNYPKALDILEAKNLLRKLIYEKAKKIQTLAAYNDFIKRYPEGAEFIDIYNLKTSDLGKKYTSGLSIEHSIKMAKAFDYRLQCDYDAKIATTGNSIFISGNTALNDTSNGQAWVIHIDQNGRFKWNKILGEHYHDYVNDIFATENGEVYGVGYTNSQRDTLTGTGWLFKLNDEGLKVWNRTLYLREATGICFNNENDFFISGYRSDSVNRPVIVKLNEEGKRLWSRQYLTRGRITCMKPDNEDNVVALADHWVFSLDKQGYLNWEAMLDTTNIASALCPLSKTKAVVSGTDTIKNTNWIRLYDNGKIKWDKTLPAKGKLEIHTIQSSEDHSRILAGGFDGKNAILFELNATGNITKKSVFDKNQLTAVTSVLKKENGFYICLNGKTSEYKGDIVLLKIE